MADLDTREKRAASVGIQAIVGPGVTNEVAKDNEWRKEVGYGYPITAAPPGGGARTFGTIIGVL